MAANGRGLAGAGGGSSVDCQSAKHGAGGVTPTLTPAGAQGRLDGSPLRPETALYGHVYVAFAAGRTKIGISLDPERRRRQIETSSGCRVEQFEVFHVYAPGPCERYLHQVYGPWRLEGEWFEEEVYEDAVEYLRPRQCGLA